MFALEEYKANVDGIGYQETECNIYINLMYKQHDAKDIHHNKNIKDEITEEKYRSYLHLPVWLLVCLSLKNGLNDKSGYEQ